MESKIPKPNMLKRPAPGTRNILPMDRIRPAVSALLGANIQTNANTFVRPPLTRDLTDLCNIVARRGRAASPDMRRKDAGMMRPRLRRSRSACEINNMRPLKRPEITLAPIPAKSARLLIANNTHSETATTSSASSKIAKSAGRPLNVTSLTKAPKNPVQSRGPAVEARSKASNENCLTESRKPTTGSKSTSVSSTGACKPINKRIPPYDYKARYNDLLEKHKILKTKFEEKCELMGNFENIPEQLEESQAQLSATRDHLRCVQTECDCLKEQVKTSSSKLFAVTSLLANTKDELHQITEDYKKLKADYDTITTEVVDLRERTERLTAHNKNLSVDLAVCKEQLFRANVERKELHNTIMDLRGNIRVFCRVRPPLYCEQDKSLCTWNYIDESTVEITNPDLISKNKAGSHVFSFDHVFHCNASQEEIFEMVSPLIQSALDGYNICIFAYGQTGSGKTFTMDGVPSNAGVIPRTVDLLFDSIKNYKRVGWEYEIKATFLEIYNEVLYDLLSNEQKDMEIRMAKNNKNDIYVSNITEERVLSAVRLRELMHIAKMNRATAATVGNDRSSRSHAVTKIELIGYHVEKNETSIGTINLVDLAGSESPKTSIRMNETKNINRSLSELTNVILALLQKQDHIPYRNSKLTHLLMPSLGGNSKTLMFINVAPFLDCFVESVKSLRFAASVNSCKVTKAKRNRFFNTSSSSSF